MKEDPETRSRIMRAVKSLDTAPELFVRHLAHAMGYRFRLAPKGPARQAGSGVSEAAQSDFRAWLLLARP